MLHSCYSSNTCHTSSEGGASFYEMSLRLLRWHFYEWPSPFRISKNRNRLPSRFSATGSDFRDTYVQIQHTEVCTFLLPRYTHLFWIIYWLIKKGTIFPVDLGHPYYINLGYKNFNDMLYYSNLQTGVYTLHNKNILNLALTRFYIALRILYSRFQQR